MRRASAAVLGRGKEVRVDEPRIICWPDRYIERDKPQAAIMFGQVMTALAREASDFA
jgi:hypothetical protein